MTSSLRFCRPKCNGKKKTQNTVFRPYTSIGNVRNMQVSINANGDAYAQSELTVTQQCIHCLHLQQLADMVI